MHDAMFTNSKAFTIDYEATNVSDLNVHNLVCGHKSIYYHTLSQITNRYKRWYEASFVISKAGNAVVSFDVFPFVSESLSSHTCKYTVIM